MVIQDRAGQQGPACILVSLMNRKLGGRWISVLNTELGISRFGIESAHHLIIVIFKFKFFEIANRGS